METEIAKQIFSEGGMIYLLFFMIVGGFIWKGIPYLLKKFDDTTTIFSQTMKEQQETFKQSLEKISYDFLNQIKASNERHEKHSQQLDEIKNLLKK